MSVIFLRPKDQCPLWKAENASERILKCRTMLKVYGFLTQSESDRINKRLSKWLDTQGQPRRRK